MLHRETEVLPAVVGLEVGVERLRVELGAGLLEGGHAGVTTAGEVDRGQVERQPEQFVAQGVVDELVDAVARLLAQAADHRCGALLRGRSSPLSVNASGLRKPSSNDMSSGV